MEIVALKLVTGEDVLGEMTANSPETGIRLKNPVGIAVVRGKDGGTNIGFSPFPIHSEPQTDLVVGFEYIHIVYSYVPAADFIKNYNGIFGAGIIVPENKIVLS
ncbi:hypothetical protein UFOVP1655_192 [uncultured Caudovirales phage]|uniref:Uncharacterized protein n=1 Tax=uncultured Caudovirales phage TaxID=2100421 RepID=A0A6J5T894_9CAUD|nr:hypothetical protein UFOVP1655_192 [uncultured Caudovirales phage]